MEMQLSADTVFRASAFVAAAVGAYTHYHSTPLPEILPLDTAIARMAKRSLNTPVRVPVLGVSFAASDLRNDTSESQIGESLSSTMLRAWKNDYKIGFREGIIQDLDECSNGVCKDYVSSRIGAPVDLTWTSGKSRSFRAGMKARPVTLRKYILVSKMFSC